jgi:mannose-6-phosphate isomerase-like protein (cupin superfamily)
MIRKQDDMTVETRDNMRGGTGSVTLRHYFKPDEFGAKTRLCALLTIPPGASIGEHAHVGEDEVYLILRGSGTVREQDGERRVTTGDAVLTGRGASHAIANNGTEPLEVAAFVILYA